MSTLEQRIADNVARVRQAIAEAAARSERRAEDVTLIAVSKYVGVAEIDALLAAGCRDLGESRPQDLWSKAEQLRGRPIRWHMIGHLQRNKAMRAVEIFDVIESVDSLALGTALARGGEERHGPVRVLVEVNLAGEASKSGVSADALPELVDGLRHLSGLRVEGLMVVPPPGSPEVTRPYFRRARALRDALRLTELSMGMSDDFEVAIEEGATIIRVGRAIFGER
jgi:hypothetical protein